MDENQNPGWFNSLYTYGKPVQSNAVPSWMGIKPVADTPLPASLTPYGSTPNWLETPAPVATGPAMNPVPTSFANGTYNPNTVTPGPFTQWLRENGIIGSTDKNGMRTDGYGGLALNAVTGLGQLYLGMQQYNLAKETLANNKAQFERNFAAQRQNINTELEDRQRARVASNAGAYQSVGDYMNQNRIK
jgi:hypothetical protein